MEIKSRKASSNYYCSFSKGVMFPPSTPQMILSMCSDSILNEMRRLKDNVTFSPEQLQEYVVYEEGFTPR